MIAGSANAAFYSQVAAFNYALKRLTWTRWTPEIYVALGPRLADESFEDSFARWRQHLKDVTFSYVSESSWDEKDNWAQVDASMLNAPRNADVYVSVDADTLPVGELETILDEIFGKNCIAGVMAHYPPPGFVDASSWTALMNTFGIEEPDLSFLPSLPCKEDPNRIFSLPIYFNGGVIFYSQEIFERFVLEYINTRTLVERELQNGQNFSGQLAMAITVSKLGLNAVILPMRFNFPNDDGAIRQHPKELEQIRIFHYLRTNAFDRRKIFSSVDGYKSLIEMELTGVNRVFAGTVRKIFGSEYPFARLEDSRDATVERGT